jgi:hypothetical protein
LGLLYHRMGVGKGLSVGSVNLSNPAAGEADG